MEVKYIEDISKFMAESNELIDVTIGFFDAVHIGHQKLIKKLESSSRKKVVITFDRHPNKQSIMSIADKVDLLSTFKIDAIYVLKLDNLNKKLSKEEFIDFLTIINVNEIIVGQDFKFGENALGDVEALRQSFSVQVISFVEENGKKISSTNIRKIIENGDLEGYFEQTRRNYKISGIVVKGNQIGRTIDFPTANIETSSQVIKPGVYVTRVYIESKSYQAVTNVGYRPTIGGEKIQIESNIFDFNDIIYSKQISVEFLKLIRFEKKFNSLEELKAQIKRDKLIAKEYYGNKKINARL